MTTNWRQRVLDSHRDDLNQWLESEDDTELDEDTVDSAQRAEWLSSVQRWDPSARHREELTIRLTGGEAGRGGLRFSVGNVLLKPLQDGVTASTDEDVELELVGISSGSTVLHVRPTSPNTAPEAPTTAAEAELSEDVPEAAEQAISVLFDAVKTVEHREDVTEWTPMLSSLSRLVSALDRFDLSVQFRWYAGDGTVSSSALTESGKRYVRELRKTHKDAFTRVERTIFGRVTELKLSGVAVIKPPASPAVSVKFEAGEITQVPFGLGDEVHLVVEERRRLARGGGNTVTEYLFLGMHVEGGMIELVEPPDTPITVRRRAIESSESESQ